MHTKYRSLLGRINWSQSRRQLQRCYKFSRCAWRAVSPTISDVKALNKLTRQLKWQPVKLQFWPRTGPLIIIAFLDASHRTMKMDLHREAWQYFYQNCESIPRRMERRMEVLLTTKVKRLREPYSQQPWQNCIHSWHVLVHASFSVDCGWTCQVGLKKFTWGLTRRTWWQQQEQFTYLSERKQFLWFPC